ncbi:MAG: bifunctional nuclease family protein [Anaerolineales bacterium]|nr:bifunctional nuclease family protein [Anaerolineales bacterium]
MTEMVEVVIDSIRVSLMSQNRIVILREADTERYLPIWIGVFEAEAIALGLQEVEVARPMTWDLLKNVFTALNARILRVEITALRDDTFFGNIVAEVEGQVINIDSRPSDALALAVRVHAPILVSRAVMDAAGVTPEKDLQEGQAETEAPAAAPSTEEGQERLSVFEDFLDKLDLGKMDSQDPDEEDKDIL